MHRMVAKLDKINQRKTVNLSNSRVKPKYIYDRRRVAERRNMIESSLGNNSRVAPETPEISKKTHAGSTEGVSADRWNMIESGLSNNSQVAPETSEMSEKAHAGSSSMVSMNDMRENKPVGCCRTCCCGRSEKFREFTQETTLHGIKYTTDTNISSYRRLLWFILLLAMVASFTTTLRESAMRFWSNPVNTVVSYREMESMPFPAVTICNYNVYRKSVVKESVLGQYLDAMYGNPFSPETDENTTLPEPPANYFANKTQIMYQSAHRIEDMLKECKLSSDVYCSAENFTKVITNFGVCYTFNGEVGNALKVRARGQQNGFFVSIDIQQNEYYYGPNVGAGLKILVHPQRDTPLVGELGLALSPGIDATLALRAMKNKLLKCDEEQLDYFDEYSTANCEMEKRTKAVVKDCQCKQPHMPGNATVCSTYQESICVYKALNKNEYGCSVPCDDVIYTGTLSFAAFPGPHVVKRLEAKYNQTEVQMRENIILLSVYMEDLTLLVTEQEEAYPVDNFLGDLGGQMGLCLGASILTVLEFWEFFLVTCCSHWKRLFSAARRPETK
ncbi:acid-sensing ion channel 4-A-like [Ptychodera flava]|uniref:acid-sensing ion channel 4-A-like n=1 Tax=Ptychodera flava TaxID=63121 RepID=UPI00396A4D4B